MVAALPMPFLPFTLHPMLALLGLLVGLAAGYLLLAVLGIRGLRFRPAAVAVVDPAGIPAAERAVLEIGHHALEKMGFRYAFCLARRQVSARLADGCECFYLHTGFDAVAVLRGGEEQQPQIVFRSYRPDGWSLETHPALPPQPLPRPVNIEVWTPTKITTLTEQWHAHLARFRARAAGSGAALPEPGQLIAHEQHLAAEALARHVASGLVTAVSARSEQHRFTWPSTLRRVFSSGPRAQWMTMQEAGLSFKRMALGVAVAALCMGCAGWFYAQRRAVDLLAQAQVEAHAAGLPTTLADISDAMSPTERRTLLQGAQWWVAAVQSAPAGDAEAMLAALRGVPGEQQAAGSAAPRDSAALASGEAMTQVLDHACSLLAADLNKQHEARADDLFHSDAIALATLLRDMHWSLGGKVQTTRVQRFLGLLTALEQHWLSSPTPSAGDTAALLAALPLPNDLQRDAVAAYFVDKIAAHAADLAPPLARFLRDSTPLGSLSLAGHRRCETALWQAVKNQRPWSDAALLPSAEQEGNLIAALHQQPSMAQRQAQMEIAVGYAPRRALCTASVAAQLLMQQLPTPQLYQEPITRALAKLSGSGPGIEIMPDAEHPVLQITLPTVPPKMVQWRLRGGNPES